MTKDVGYKFAKELLDSPTYIALLKDQLESGTLPAMLVKRLWDYAYGKPAEKIQVEMTTKSLEDMNPEQLQEHMQELMTLAQSLEEKPKELTG